MWTAANVRGDGERRQHWHSVRYTIHVEEEENGNDDLSDVFGYTPVPPMHYGVRIVTHDALPVLRSIAPPTPSRSSGGSSRHSGGRLRRRPACAHRHPAHAQAVVHRRRADAVAAQAFLNTALHLGVHLVCSMIHLYVACDTVVHA